MPVQLLIHTIIQSANHVASVWCIQSCRYSSAASVNIKIGKNMISVSMVWAFVKLLFSWDFQSQQSLEFLLRMEPTHKTLSGCPGDGNALLMREVSGEESPQLWWAGKNIPGCKTMSNLKVDGLQEQKTNSSQPRTIIWGFRLRETVGD